MSNWALSSIAEVPAQEVEHAVDLIKMQLLTPTFTHCMSKGCKTRTRSRICRKCLKSKKEVAHLVSLPDSIWDLLGGCVLSNAENLSINVHHEWLYSDLLHSQLDENELDNLLNEKVDYRGILWEETAASSQDVDHLELA